jgi:hypothetical protein
MTRAADQEYDRLMQLLDVGLTELRKGDGQTTVMVLEEALKTAERRPNKSDAVIHLPDQSRRTP